MNTYTAGLVLWAFVAVIQLSCAANNDHGESSSTNTISDDQNRCIDFELSQIDAITRMQNGSLFLSSKHRYWILKENEIPLLSTARPVSKLLTFDSHDSDSSGVRPSNDSVANGDDQKFQSNTSNDNKLLTIDAAVNIQLKAQNGSCVPANQILLYTKLPDQRPLLTIYENDVLYSTTNLSHSDVLRAAKSVDWTRKIDGLTFFNNMTIIFQGEYFTSVRCSGGQWKEILHKRLRTVFPGVNDSPVDSVYIRSQALQPFDMSYVLMFYGHQYYECSTTGNDPCEGPYNVMSEFFDVHQFCPNSGLSYGASANGVNLLLLLVIVVVTLLVLLVVASVLFFTLKPEHFTYFVNGKMRSNNYGRDQLSYEALKLQTDTTTGGVECKAIINGNS